MKKDIEWLKAEVEKQDIVMDKGYIYTSDLLYLIDKLDEPEVLSQKWIDENKETRINNLRKRTTSDVVPVEDLQNLLVPKQELPVIPKYYVDLNEAAYVVKWDGDNQVNIYTHDIFGSDEFEFHLTEQEIKSYDERFKSDRSHVVP